MQRIEVVEEGSYAADLQLECGDRLLSINDRPINDLIDYYQALDSTRLRLEILREDGELCLYQIEKEPEEDLGLELSHPQPRQCGNNCVFCFVHQLPKGMRRTLYVKDEDYRFSYLYGSYITLSNITPDEIDRIIAEQLSPLYISVHATDDELRARLLGCQAPPILPLLRQLVAGGIELHCQIVLCPEWNDGQALRQSIEQLADLHPQLASLAVVPVGLTGHRQNLPELRKLTTAEAVATVELIETYQRGYLAAKGSRFVFAADEIYLQAGSALPDLADYENLPQLENGVGLVAQFRQQAEEVLLEAEPLELGLVSLITGTSFAPELESFIARLQLRTGIDLQVLPIENRFFGSEVTVSGLLTGQDLLEQLAGKILGDGVLLPDILFKQGEQLLLDDLSLEQLSQQLACPVEIVESSPWGILDGLEKLAAGPVEIIHC